jgi:hypothetical protein
VDPSVFRKWWVSIDQTDDIIGDGSNPKIAGEKRIDSNPPNVLSNDEIREEKMALNVHGGNDIGKAVLWIVGVVAFVAIALTKVPEWISPDSAKITGNTGATTRMIN